MTWAGACVRSPCFNTSLSRCSISGSFAANFGGTWIKEPKVLAFSNNSRQGRDVALGNVALLVQCFLAEQRRLRFLDLLEQILARWHLLLVNRRVESVRDIGSVHPLAILKRQDVRLRLTVEDAAVVGTGLHHKGEGRKLCRPVVDFQTEQVLFQDQRAGCPLHGNPVPGRSL